ncbi:MAG: pilus assembly protein PilM [Nitrospirae bacterium]|nr:pilus assembly protein PilM [Nitrospirota bacterium]
MLFDRLFGTFLGFEFREDSVVATYLRNSPAGISLLSSSTFPMKDLKDESAFNEVREYVGKHGVNINKVFVSIPDKWAITKFADIPSIKGKGKGALANLMKFEIERHIPFNLEDVAYDFLVMKEMNTSYSVAFVVVQKEKMELIKEFLEKLALRYNAFTISSFAVLNALELSGVSAGGLLDIIGVVRKSKILGKKGETVISLYIDKMNASLSLLKDGLCIHHRTFNTAKPLGIFIDDITKYLTELQARLSIESYRNLILSGDIASFVNLAEDLKEKLKLNIVTLDKLAGYSGNIKGLEINNAAASVGACFAGLGIGTYKINLLPHRTEYEAKRLAPLTAKALLILICVLIVGIFTAEAVKRKKFLTGIENELKKNEPVIAAIEKLTSDTGVLKSRIAMLDGLKKSEITLEMLAELATVLPKDAWITNLDYKGVEIKDDKKTGGELVISGYAGASSALIPLLEDSSFFEKVEFVGPIKKAGDKEQFKLSAKVVMPVKEEEELKAEGVKEGSEEDKKGVRDVEKKPESAEDKKSKSDEVKK